MVMMPVSDQERCVCGVMGCPQGGAPCAKLAVATKRATEGPHCGAR